MKKTLVLCILALGFGSASANQPNGSKEMEQTQSSKINWYTDYSKAANLAKNENKPMLLFFTGSDWCGWCKKMDQEVFASSAFAQEMGNKMVFIEVDFPMNKPLSTDQQQKNNELKKKYGITGYPTIIVLDASGNFIAETGYRPGGGKSYADYLKQLLN